VDLEDFNFLSSNKIDRKIYYAEGTLSLSAYGFNTFNISHGESSPFVPILRFSTDGGTTWLYGGDSWFGGASAYTIAKAKANGTTVRIETNNQPTARTIKYQIYGIASDV